MEPHFLQGEPTKSRARTRRLTIFSSSSRFNIRHVRILI